MLKTSIRAAAALAAAVTLAGAIVAGERPVGASPIDDQKAKVAQITDQLAQLEKRSDILAEQFVIASAKVDETRVAVAETEKRIADKTHETNALRDQLAAMAVRTFTGAGSPQLNPLFTNLDDTTSGLQRDHLTQVALSAGTATTDQLDDALADLDAERDRLADEQRAAESAIAEMRAAKTTNDAERTNYQQARQQAEAELGDLINQEEERRARESYERMQREAEEARAAEAAKAQAAAAQAQATARTSRAAPAPTAQAASPQAAPRGAASPPAQAAPRPAAPDPAPTVAPPSSRAGAAVAAAMSQLGVPYVAYASSPGVGFDCSGLTSWAWGQAGVSLPHQSGMQSAALPHVPPSDAQPGDLIFYYSPISHVGIYIGGGKLIHAPNTGSVVNIATVHWEKVVGVARPG
jgi:peptidoglycan DL-endopeptidase CwlO